MTCSEDMCLEFRWGCTFIVYALFLCVRPDLKAATLCNRSPPKCELLNAIAPTE